MDSKPDPALLRWIILLRWLALTLALLGVAWDLVTGWWYFLPGPSGEWSRLAIFAAAVGGIPAGLFAMLFYIIARKPATKLRLPILSAAALSVLFPILLTLYDRWH
jgi:hypothetical protein